GGHDPPPGAGQRQGPPGWTNPAAGRPRLGQPGNGMKVLPARHPPPPPAPERDRAALPAEPSGSAAAPVGLSGSFEVGVAVVAVAGVALGLGAGTRILGAGALALYALLCAALALLATVARPRRLSPRGRARLRGWALAVVLLAGAALRFRGITFALPYVPHPDEPAVVNVAQRMLINGDLDPHRFIYPSFYIYLQVITYALHLAWGFTQGTYRSVQDLPNSTDIVTTAPGIYLWGRSLTALLGTGAIALVYGIGQRLYGPRAGLVAALLLAFS